MGKKVYGYWKCPTCGRKDIRSDVRHCPSCGTACGAGTEFYMCEGVVEYIEDDNSDKYSGKPDWVCSYCDTLNSTYNDLCKNCGATRSDSELNYFTVLERKQRQNMYVRETVQESERYKTNRSDLDNYSDSTDTLSGIKNAGKRSQNVSGFTKPATDRIRLTALYVAIGALCLGLLIFLISLFIPKPATINVQSFSWERNIDIEESYIAHESDWTVPAGGKVKYTRIEEDGTTAILDGYKTKERNVQEKVVVGTSISISYKNNGDGSFDEVEHVKDVTAYVDKTETYTVTVTHYEPVMRTKYYYDIERWRVVNTVTTLGADRNPYWGEVNLKDKQRRGSDREKYWVTAVNMKTEETIRYSVNYSLWNELPESGVVNVKIGVGNHITEIVADDAA